MVKSSPLRREVGELGKEYSSLQDAKAMAFLITVRAERCCGLQDDVERSVARASLINNGRNTGKVSFRFPEFVLSPQKGGGMPRNGTKILGASPRAAGPSSNWMRTEKAARWRKRDPSFPRRGAGTSRQGDADRRADTPKGLRGFLEIYQQKSGEGTLAGAQWTCIRPFISG